MPTYPITLPNFITGFVSTASMEQKQCLLALLTEEMYPDATNSVCPIGETEELQGYTNPTNMPAVAADTADTADDVPLISDYVEHINDLGISKELSEGVLNELNSLKLRTRGYNGRPAKVKTQWLSPNNEPYKYGKVVNKPRPIGDFPQIMSLMDMVNQHPSTTGDMNACLVSCMSTARSNLNYHADNEDLIVQDSDICTVSFGPTRTLDFVWYENNRKGRKGPPPPPDYSVPATNHSLNVMKAGCQAKLQHRVPPGTESGVRYSISFRKILEPSSHSSEQITHRELLAADSNQDNDINPVTPTPASTNAPKKKIVLLAGDSFFARLDEKKLGKDKQEVYNVAKGGQKISQVQQTIENFINKNPGLDIKTLFVCVGTNDIRNCQQGIAHLKPALSKFMKSIKALAPNAKIFMQSLLPIPSNGNPKAERNVLAMNNLIYNLCSKYKLFYIDVFNSFLNSHGNRNLSLFPTFDRVKNLWDIHPNARGMGVLAKHYIYLIHSKRFNPLGY